MATADSTDITEDATIQKTFMVLEKSQSDNEKLAALLLFAKATNAKELSNDDRRRALNAIGVTFLSRLMKSRTVPEDCSATVYKDLALKILSGLCTDSEMLIELEVHKVLRSLNEIITDNTSDMDIVTDSYDLLSVFVQSEESAIKLVDFGTVASLAEVVCNTIQGCDRGQAILHTLLYHCGEYAWKKDSASMHLILNHFAKQLESLQDERKFEMCGTVAGILTSLPKDLGRNCTQKSWYKSIVQALSVIFKNKLGQTQRDAALALASTVLDRLGAESILPPNTENCKLLLIVIHLSCIEVRMTLENLAPDQILTKTETLVSCYNILETIIGYLTSAPSLQLDEDQVLQLHSAMEGAFNAVIFYLKEQSSDVEQVDQPNQIVLASIRVLGSWLAEETSALKARVQEILPFVVSLCNCQISCQGHSSQKKKKVVQFKNGCENDLSSKVQGCDISMETDTNNQCSERKPESDCTDSRLQDISDQDESSNSCKDTDCTCSADDKSNDPDCKKCKSLADSEQRKGKSHKSVLNKGKKSDMATVLPDLTIDNVDLVRFLLPGFCHMTAEDTTRQILLENNFHSILSVYFSKCVEAMENNLSEDSLRCMETLCGVLLNLAVLEPELVASSEDLHKITRSIFRCATLIYNRDNTLTVWANVVTLGVFFLKYQIDVKFDKDELTKFFSMVVSFIRAPYTSSVVNGSDVLTVTESYVHVWDSIYQLWYLCVQASTCCLSVYPSLVYAMMSTGFLPHVIRLLNKVKGKNVDEDTLLCIIGVITSLITTEAKAMDVFKSCGGLEFSRLYNCSELENMIEQ